MSGSVVIEKSGPLCTVQDLGRRTGRRAGVAPGGAMDQRACLWANYLLGNPPDAAVLEVSLGGARIVFEAPAVVALTGADCEATLDGVPVGNWGSIRVAHGAVLSLQFSVTGMRSYIAFPGGLSTPAMFGSASVVLREGLPGRLGRPVQTGDRLEWHRRRDAPVRSVPFVHRPRVEDPIELPLITGYEWDDFSASDRERLLTTEWTVGSNSDRVATRLRGAILESGPSILDSVPLVDGTVQVPGDGCPLVFMRDRPTIGGYPKLGSVDPVALDGLAQARPGASIRFVQANAAKVLERIRRREAFFGLGAPAAEGASSTGSRHGPGGRS